MLWIGEKVINLSTPILQIKTNGFNLKEVKEIKVTIMSNGEKIKKENNDIEIDNEIILVSLTQEESNKLKSGEANISISAEDYNDADVSASIRVMSVKKSSRTGEKESGNFVTNNVFAKTVSEINENIEDLENGLSISGERIYLDYQDGKYGFNTDPNRGADTFTPFKSSSGGSAGIQSPLVIPINFVGVGYFYTNSYNLDVRNYLPEQIQKMVKKIEIKDLTVMRNNQISGRSGRTFIFRIYGTKNGEIAESYAYSRDFSTTTNSTMTFTDKINDLEIDATGYEEITSFGVYSSQVLYSAGSQNAVNYSFIGTMEIYFDS